jgi:hypothetical protein
MPRLEKIRKDFPLWFNGSIPRCLKRVSTFLNKGKCGWRLANFYYSHYIPLSALSHGRLTALHTMSLSLDTYSI